MRKLWYRLWFWILWPGLFVYLRGSHRSRILIVCDDQVLVVKDRSKVWFDEDRFGIPGGGIRASETAEHGAVRELAEELGLTVEASQLKALGEGRIGERGLSYYAHFFLLTLPLSTELHLQTSEIAEACWRNIDSLAPRDLKPDTRRALQLLADH
jgi:8-oxo-dGTP diphosphatase